MEGCSGGRIAGVGQNDDADGSDEVAGELKVGQVAALAEHSLSRTEDDREGQEAVFVDEIVLREAADRCPGAEHDEVAVGAVLIGRQR